MTRLAHEEQASTLSQRKPAFVTAVASVGIVLALFTAVAQGSNSQALFEASQASRDLQQILDGIDQQIGAELGKKPANVNFLSILRKQVQRAKDKNTERARSLGQVDTGGSGSHPPGTSF